MAWREVPSCPGYLASEDGKIKGPSGRVLSPGTSESGHRYVCVGRRRHRSVHSMVLEAFVGPRPEGPNIVALHEDDDPNNNHIKNLSWGTQSKNLQDAYLRGRRSTKLCADRVREIRRLYELDGVTHQILAGQFGVTKRTIQQVVLRRTWQHV